MRPPWSLRNDRRPIGGAGYPSFERRPQRAGFKEKPAQGKKFFIFCIPNRVLLFRGTSENLGQSQKLSFPARLSLAEKLNN